MHKILTTATTTLGARVSNCSVPSGIARAAVSRGGRVSKLLFDEVVDVFCKNAAYGVLFEAKRDSQACEDEDDACVAHDYKRYDDRRTSLHV